jgi:hypothetical protein
MVNTRVVVAAAVVLLLPAWSAFTLQVPTEISVSVVPLTEQVLDVVEKLTGRPDVAVATSGPGAVPRVWLVDGPVKLMVCDAAAIVNTRDAAAAGA